MRSLVRISLAFICFAASASLAQSPLVALDQPAVADDFGITANARATAIYVVPQSPETVRVAAEAFASDVETVTGVKPHVLTSLTKPLPSNMILVGVLGRSPEIDRLVTA